MKQIFKKSSFWIIAIALIISLLIIFMPSFMSESNSSLSFRLFISSTIFFIALIIVLLTIIFRKEETKNKIEAKLEKRKEEAKYSKLLREKKIIISKKFKEALKTIKNSSFYKSRTKANYELPWYFLLGDKDSGKTSLLRNSSLDLPLNVEGGEDKENNIFTWFYTENSIFIDIKGDVLNQENNSENSMLWIEFLNIFRKKRWKRPINGVILTIPADTILALKGEALEIYIKSLRDRFDEISNKFLSTIPIYLIITKSDKIEGFKEYFSLLKDNEKDEVLGVTFNSEEKQISKDTIKPYFENLLKRLNSPVIEKMYFEWEEGRRWKTFLFCQKFSEVLEKSDNFISKCFSNTRYRTPLLLRGIYFTTILDADYLKQIEEHNILEESDNSTKKRGMFIKKLFTDIIFSEVDMIKLDERYEKDIAKKQYIFYAFVVFLVAFLSFFMVKDFIKQTDILSSMTEDYIRYENSKKTLLAEDNYNNIVEILNKIEQIRIINKTKIDDNIWNLSFYKSNDRDDKLQNIYHTDLVKLLLNEVANSIELNIKTQLRDFETTWNNTKAYLMLQNLERRDNKYLLDYMAKYWNERYANMPKIQEDLNKHWGKILEFGFGSFEINQNSLKLARDSLKKFNQAQLTYKIIRNDGLKMPIKEFSFSKAMSSYANFFSDDNYVIPGFFTKEGFAVIMTKGLELTTNALKNNWVIEDSANANNLEVEKQYKKILTLYLNEYKNYWNEALSKLKVNRFSTVLDLNNQLSLITSPASPILDVLKAVKENTEIYTPFEQAMQNKNNEEEQKAKKVINEVAKVANGKLDLKQIAALRSFFKPYNDLLDKNYQPTNILSIANEKINSTNTIMTTLKEAISPNKDAFEIVRNRVQGKEKSILSSVNYLPNYTKNWYRDILKSNWNYILNEAKVYVNEKYQENVYGFYNLRLKNKYPFSKNNNYVTLADFEEFFKANGIVDKFYKDYLSIFLTINENSFVIKYKNLDGSSIKVNKNMESSLQLSYKIKQAFFKANGDFGLEVIIEPYKLSNNLATVSLEYANSSLNYEHGPIISKKMVFPLEGNNAVKFKLFDLNYNLAEELYITNEWALFELLDMFEVKKYSGSENVYEYIKNDYSASFLIKGYLNDMIDKKSGLAKFILDKEL